MKKLKIAMLALAMLLSAAGCSNQPADSQGGTDTAASTASAETTVASDSAQTGTDTANSAAVTETAAASVSQDSTTAATTTIIKQPEPPKGNTEQLVNKMTEQEKQKAVKRKLTLLNAAEDEKATVGIQFSYMDVEYVEEVMEQHSKDIPEDERKKIEAELARLKESGEQYKSVGVVTINGCFYNGLTPDLGYQGGVLSYSKQNETGIQSVQYNTMEEYFAALPENLRAQGMDEEAIASRIKQEHLVFDAVMNKTYEEIPAGTIDPRNMPSTFWNDPFLDFRSTWTFDRNAVSAISDSIDEYSIYDDELATEFLVHVVLPPNYDKDKTYPVLFLTDGVWRFGDTPELRKIMEDGNAADVLLVTLGYGYQYDGSSDFNRFTHLMEMRGELLNFVTDNLMPYLGAQYHIDYANSTLYGHSDGGVFSHYALCQADAYENQPFGRYIIGSPVFWGLYNESYFDLDPTGSEHDYGYFDRFEKLNKKVFLCGGSEEDSDFSDKYNGHATTLEGLEKLYERLKQNGADVTYKLYSAHHTQYIAGMLAEYLQTEYPKQ